MTSGPMRLSDDKPQSETETPSDETSKPNPVREAAVGKLKAAILAAALRKCDSDESNRNSAQRTDSLSAQNRNSPNKIGKDSARERRRSAGDESENRYIVGIVKKA